MNAPRKRPTWPLTILTYIGVAIAFVGPSAAASVWTGGAGL